MALRVRDIYSPSTEGASRGRLCSSAEPLQGQHSNTGVLSARQTQGPQTLKAVLTMNKENIHHQRISPRQHNFLRVQTRSNEKR